MSQVITTLILGNYVFVKATMNRLGSHHWFTGVVLCLALWNASCAALQRSASAALPLAEVLPAAWSPLRDVEEINIDGDAAPEYLLFFSYDTTTAAAPQRTLFSLGSATPSGPIGAVIYDGQVVTGTTPTIQVSPDRPTTAFVPYAILPSYRDGAGLGYVAEPTQSEAIAAYAVSYRAAGQTTGAAAVAAPDTVILLGGETYLTFAWWQNRAAGYGVTQLNGPGGFEQTLYQPFDWAAWQRAPQPIREIIAVHPLHDRNRICRRFHYTIDEAALSAGRPGPGSPLRFRKNDLGLHFCAGTPVHPFYPEGVVLAYLLEGNAELLDSSTSPPPVTLRENKLPWVRQLIQDDGVLRVDDLASYITLKANANAQPTDPLDIIRVCALLTLQPVGKDTATMPPQEGLLFILRHEPARSQPPTPDRLFIQTVESIPAPGGSGMIDCKEQLGD